ncbi:MAG: hypothetical protein NT023_12165 [Armatimonadetes bacterium]|nr:hypothetical protein [Armatimonadota bacterium]
MYVLRFRIRQRMARRELTALLCAILAVYLVKSSPIFNVSEEG